MIKATDIIVEGNPLLREKSQEVNIPLTKEDEALLLEMVEYIDNSMDEEIAKKYNLTPSVGIAAVQVGIPKKMLVVWAIDEKGYEHLYPMINPKIVSYSDEMSYLPMGEACLSVPRQAPGYIHRPARVTVDTYLYEKRSTQKSTPPFEKLYCDCFPARIRSSKRNFVCRPNQSGQPVFCSGKQ